MALDYLRNSVSNEHSNGFSHDEQAPAPRKRNSWVKLIVLLVVACAIGGWYHFRSSFVQNAYASIRDRNKVPATGIIYNEEKPAVLIDHQVFYEGDIYKNYEIVQIHRDRIELEKNGKTRIQYCGEDCDE